MLTFINRPHVLAKKPAQALVRPGIRVPKVGVFRSSHRPHAPHQSIRSLRFRADECTALLSRREIDGEVKVAEEDPSPYFEPLLRTFILGVSFGGLCELLHVFVKFAERGSDLPFQLVDTMQSLSPIVFWDHVAAVGSWLLFYGIEAAVVYAIIQRYGGDSFSAAQAITRTSTLPKQMLPLNLNQAKRFISKLLSGRSLRLATASAGLLSAPRQSLARPTPPTPTPLAESPVEPPSPQSFASTAVLERPATLTPPAPTSVIVDRPVMVSREEPQLSFPPLPNKPSTRPGQEGGKKREKELRDRNACLKNFWYAAGLSSALKDKPLEVTMLGTTLVLWRDAEGKAHCMDNACPHRGAPLSKGWVKTMGEGSSQGESVVVCPYHGWSFDTHGCLKEVPSQLEDCSFPKRPLVDVYPVEEKGGFIWMFYGSSSLPADERPPIPFCDELADPKWKAVYGELEFECGHHSVFENAIDMAHIHYLHGDSFGNQGAPEIMDMQVERNFFDIRGTFSIFNKPVSPIWQFTSVPVVPVEYRAYLPSTSYVKITLGAGVSMITFVSTVPISPTRSVNRFCLIRNFAPSAVFDGWARRSMFRILGEDKVMVEELKPEDVAAEVSLQADLPQIAFRKLRQEWIDLGYGVYPEDGNRVRRVDL